MKIAITAQGQDLNAQLDPRFGRTSGFILYDTQSKNFSYLDNQQNLSATQGAGIQTAQNVADSGAQAVLTGHVGPKAYTALERGGIDIYLVNGGTVQDAITAFENGDLTPAAGADKPGHW
ncbi:MAG: NifB/NifX family molybdenum-iron cluster-binding protein [Thermodesulfobacteriota bacterium]